MNLILRTVLKYINQPDLISVLLRRNIVVLEKNWRSYLDLRHFKIKNSENVEHRSYNI